jgi:hypothetical protein
MDQTPSINPASMSLGKRQRGDDIEALKKRSRTTSYSCISNAYLPQMPIQSDFVELRNIHTNTKNTPYLLRATVHVRQGATGHDQVPSSLVSLLFNYSDGPLQQVQGITSHARTLTEQQLDSQHKWLSLIKDDFTNNIRQFGPGIPKDFALPLNDPNFRLLPQNTWQLRSLSPQDRHITFLAMMTLAQKMESVPPSSAERFKVWVQIRDMSRFLIERERRFYAPFSPDGDSSSKELRLERLQAHM